MTADSLSACWAISQPVVRFANARQPKDSKSEVQAGADMADGARYSRALILGASVVSIAALVTESGLAQTAQPQAESVSPERPKQAKRKQAKPVVAQQAAPEVMNARAQAGGVAPVQALDTITAAASKTEERAVDALAPV